MNDPQPSAHLEELTRFAISLARESGDIIRSYFGRPDLRVEAKSDRSPVTEADRRAEEAMRRSIAGHHPDHGIVGEEFGSEREDSEFVWILDPIDGTISFAAGCPLFGSLIGILRDGVPVLGIIHNPVLDRLCVGTSTETTINGTPARLRRAGGLEGATLLTTDLATISEYRDYAAFDALRSRTGLFRMWGDCYGYLLLVSGGADIMVDPIMNAWDLLPLVPIVRGAGGVITSWDGSDPVGADSCVAAAPALHADVIRILNTRGHDPGRTAGHVATQAT